MQRVSFLFLVLCGILGGFFSLPAESSELIKVEEALQQIFKTATAIEKEEFCLSAEQVLHIEKKADLIFKEAHSVSITRYTARQEGQVIGYGYEDIVHGKWGPIHYLAALAIDGKILEIVILDYQEIRGKPIAKKRFLKQYKGKTINQPLRLRKDIDGITGATISSRSLTDGIRKILYLFHEVKPEAFRTACESP